MNTRDLGTHMVELHDQGTLDIIGSNVRLTLPAREVVELLHWLNEHRNMLHKVTQSSQDTREVIAELQAEQAAEATTQDEPDIPVDEP
jgi:hypothetical protein